MFVFFKEKKKKKKKVHIVIVVFTILSSKPISDYKSTACCRK